MNYSIQQAELIDLPAIYQLFEEAILFQKANNYIGWKNYDTEFLKADVESGNLYKIISDGNIICIFSVCFNDSLIWREKENGDSLYLHRVVLNQKYKGQKGFEKTLEWARSFAVSKGLKKIRLDTWADNEKIIAYYKGYGFSSIKNYVTPNTEDLPVQHRNLNVALLELNLSMEAIESKASSSISEISINHLDKVNITEELSEINKYWNQKIIGNANGQLIKLAKGSGELNWHSHPDQDELFILYKGHLSIQLRNKTIELYPNEMFIVPKGVEHCPISNGHTEFLIMGLNITSNTSGGRPEKWAD